MSPTDDENEENFGIDVATTEGDNHDEGAKTVLDMKSSSLDAHSDPSIISPLPVSASEVVTAADHELADDTSEFGFKDEEDDDKERDHASQSQSTVPNEDRSSINNQSITTEPVSVSVVAGHALTASPPLSHQVAAETRRAPSEASLRLFSLQRQQEEEKRLKVELLKIELQEREREHEEEKRRIEEAARQRAEAEVLRSEQVRKIQEQTRLRMQQLKESLDSISRRSRAIPAADREQAMDMHGLTKEGGNSSTTEKPPESLAGGAILPLMLPSTSTSLSTSTADIASLDSLASALLASNDSSQAPPSSKTIEMDSSSSSDPTGSLSLAVGDDHAFGAKVESSHVSESSADLDMHSREQKMLLHNDDFRLSAAADSLEEMLVKKAIDEIENQVVEETVDIAEEGAALKVEGMAASAIEDVRADEEAIRSDIVEAVHKKEYIPCDINRMSISSEAVEQNHVPAIVSQEQPSDGTPGAYGLCASSANFMSLAEDAGSIETSVSVMEATALSQLAQLSSTVGLRPVTVPLAISSPSSSKPNDNADSLNVAAEKGAVADSASSVPTITSTSIDSDPLASSANLVMNANNAEAAYKSLASDATAIESTVSVMEATALSLFKDASLTVGLPATAAEENGADVAIATRSNLSIADNYDSLTSDARAIEAPISVVEATALMRLSELAANAGGGSNASLPMGISMTLAIEGGSTSESHTDGFFAESFCPSTSIPSSLPQAEEQHQESPKLLASSASGAGAGLHLDNFASLSADAGSIEELVSVVEASALALPLSISNSIQASMKLPSADYKSLQPEHLHSQASIDASDLAQNTNHPSDITIRSTPVVPGAAATAPSIAQPVFNPTQTVSSPVSGGLSPCVTFSLVF